MFSNSSHVQISGNSQLTYVDNRNNANSQSIDDGMRLLISRVVKGAMHNSVDRFDAPTCHPETRIALQDDVLGWADELVDDLNEIVTWLYGPAGAGKSAIAQTIAQKLHDRGQLTASFFFSRASGDQGRGAETDFVATLAYQLSISVPATRPHIAAAVRDNPLIFDLALRDQVGALIVAPLIAISQTLSGTEKKVIVVDGLDECRKEKDAQRRVVDALISGLRQIPNHTHKLFITSRPEYHIVSIFNNHEARMLRRMELNDKWKPDDDIRTFLLSGFAAIRRSHPYFQIHPTDNAWPSHGIIEALVRKSSGHFIFASVVLKYIKSDENYSPVSRLDTILSLKNNDDRPYAELDALYHYIFSQIRGVEVVLSILFLERLYQILFERLYETRGDLTNPFLSTFLSEVLDLDKGVILFRLRPLISVLVWSDEDEIRYEHASLPDFLMDESRSGPYYINSHTIVAPMISRVLKRLGHGPALQRERVMFLLSTPVYYGKVLPPDQKFHIWRLLSDFDIVNAVLCMPAEEFDDDFSRILSDYLNLIIAESKDECFNDTSGYLSKPVAEIVTWLIDKLKLLNFDHSVNGSTDLRPFFFATDHWIGDEEQELSDELPLVLEVLGYSYMQIQEIDLPHLNQATLLYHLMKHLHFLGRSDLLGPHAITIERFGVALQRTAYYLLRLPEHTLLDLVEYHPSPGHDPTPPILRLIATVLSRFCRESPFTTELYFLVALLYPVLVALEMVDVPIYRGTASAYMHSAIEKFPFLTDPTSAEYIQASAEVKNALMKLNIKSYLHKVAETRHLTWFFENKLTYRSLLETFAVIDIRVSDSCDRVAEL